MNNHFKDEILNSLAVEANVAQFVSFGPEGEPIQRFCRVAGWPANKSFGSPERGVEYLLRNSPDRAVNIRSFLPDRPQGHEFIYGISTVEAVVEQVRRLSSNGFYTIVNETVDVNDGGVSGVLEGGIAEFAPGVIPRFVEKPNQDEVPALPRQVAIRLLALVYGIAPRLGKYGADYRVEFSIHPVRRGWRREHTIIWEIQKAASRNLDLPQILWPNAFSRYVGDKAYGLLVASATQLPVPRTIVFPRRFSSSSRPRLSAFCFGTSTGSDGIWMRTCPSTQVPGRYTTLRGWKDPYKIMQEDDPIGDNLVSCLAQEQVDAQYSGALLTSSDGHVLIEGVRGFGDSFMLGRAAPESLPRTVQRDVRALYRRAVRTIGPARMEWAHDGRVAWVLQLHAGTSVSSGRVVVPGNPPVFHRFDAIQGLEVLRELAHAAAAKSEGIVVFGNVGVTSHIADILRRAHVPSRIESA